MKQNNEKPIEDIVFQTLCRVCKENKIYSYLICSISLNNYILSSISTYRNIMLSNKENPFSKCNSKTEFIELLKTMKRNYPKDFGDVRKKQMMVMDYVNALIHYCLERYICRNNLVKIEDIGSETFETSCKKIFGDNFKVICVVVDKDIRKARIAERNTRALTSEEVDIRDLTEIENIEKAGPIAIADYYILNNSDKNHLLNECEKILVKLNK